MKNKMPEFIGDLPNYFWQDEESQILRYQSSSTIKLNSGEWAGSADDRYCDDLEVFIGGVEEYLLNSNDKGIERLELTIENILSYGGNRAEFYLRLLENLKNMRIGSIHIHQVSNFENPKLSHLTSRLVQLDRTTDINIQNSTIGTLIVSARNSATLNNITLESCNIGKLSIKRDNEDWPETLNLTLQDCTIGIMEISTKGLRNFTTRNSHFAKRYIKHLDEQVPPSHKFLDRVSFSSLHKWAEETGNSKIAHLARAHELAIEHAESERSEKPFFVLWKVFSDYGLSFWRPLIWLLTVNFLFFDVLLYSGTALGLPSESYTGWKSALIGEELLAQGYRALVGTGENFLSPFSLFSGRRLVVPEQGWASLVQLLVGYTSLGLIFLFGFAVRRRFKV